MLRLLPGGLLVLAMLAPAQAACLSAYAGTWEGAMHYDHPLSVSDATDDGQRYRIVGDGGTVRMLQERGGTFQDTGLNRVVVAADHVKLTWVAGGEDRVVISNGWCLTLRDADTLIARQVRAGSDGTSECVETIPFGGVFKRVGH